MAATNQQTVYGQQAAAGEPFLKSDADGARRIVGPGHAGITTYAAVNGATKYVQCQLRFRAASISGTEPSQLR